MAQSKMYDGNGNTKLSSRGSGVLKMIRAFLKQEEGHGAMAKAHREYANGQVDPVCYGRFRELVNAFVHPYQRGDNGPFVLLNDTKMTYEQAIQFANEVNEMVNKAERFGYTMTRNRGRVPRTAVATA